MQDITDYNMFQQIAHNNSPAATRLHRLNIAGVVIGKLCSGSPLIVMFMYQRSNRQVKGVSDV